MKVSSKDKIWKEAVLILNDAPNGIRYTELIKLIHEKLPEIPINTIHGTIWNLEVMLSDKVWKPARGLYLHSKFRQAQAPAPPIPKIVIKEDQYYKSFADWLINELEECTKAVAVGGNRFKDKWGTPDVIGVREPRKSDIIKFTTEIVSAEIKIDPTNLITAFGQSCAYRLFSHKSYIVIPNDSPPDDISRLDVLSRIFGIGLILFNSKNPDDPSYEIRVRAAKHDPDMFYVNRCMKTIERELFE